MSTIKISLMAKELKDAEPGSLHEVDIFEKAWKATGLKWKIRSQKITEGKITFTKFVKDGVITRPDKRTKPVIVEVCTDG